MDEERSREAMLRDIRGANVRRQPEAIPSFDWRAASLPTSALVDLFVRRAEAAQASVSVVSDDAGAAERVARIRDALGGAEVGVTRAEYGVADTGTVVVCSAQPGGRSDSLWPPAHIAVLDANDLVERLPDLLTRLRRDGRLQESSAVTLITGPSRTADIELTLTIGVHGPKQLFVILVDRKRGRTP